MFYPAGLVSGDQIAGYSGSDGAGVVEEVGEGVDPVWRGQAVVINPSMHWGNNPKFYGPDYRMLGMPENGTFADYAVVGVNYIHHKTQLISLLSRRCRSVDGPDSLAGTNDTSWLAAD